MQSIPGILKKIVKTKEVEVNAILNMRGEFRSTISNITPAMSFESALKNNGINSIIAEVKKASPAAGLIDSDFNYIDIATEYEKAGVSAISVLTDRDYFKGDVEYLKQIRKVVNIPILRKDFVISELQILEARAIGADSFLLIVRILTDSQLKEFISLGRELGMEPLVEVFDMYDLERAIASDAKIIGVNNRDLNSFTVDVNNSISLYSQIPKGVISVSESGIASVEVCRNLYSTGFNTLLIGEFFMRSKNKKQLIHEIISH